MDGGSSSELSGHSHGAASIRVLGPTGVAIGHEPIPLRSAHQRRLVAALVLARGETVTHDRLAEAVWGDDLPADPRGALHNHVSRLRVALRGIEAITTAPGGYRLDVNSRTIHIDAVAFEDAIREARSERDAGRRADLLDGAVSMWNSDAAYEDLDTDAARAEAMRLHELRLAAHEDAAAARLACGDTASVVAALDGFCVAHPLRENPRLTLARALASSSRSGEALRVLEEFRRQLVTEMGMQPSPAVDELVREILAGSEHVGPRERRAMCAAPRLTTAIFGRDRDIEGVEGRIASARVVSIVGPGGVGKSTLALAVVSKVADDVSTVAYADLASVAQDEDPVPAIARAVGIDRLGAEHWTDRLVEGLAGRQLLLVIDNAEHVIDSVARTVAAIVRRTDVSVLVTSREALRLTEERLWPLEPLSCDAVDGAVDLFYDRARALIPGWDANDNDHEVVRRICRRLDGLPLAVELAAPHVRFMSCDELLARLDRPLDALDEPSRRESRHRGLRSVVDASYELLDVNVREVFARVCVFVNGFTPEAAAVVCGRRVDVELRVLVERSLLRARIRPYGTRYSMLQTLRDYAFERLERDEVSAEVRAAHARAIVGQVEHALSGLWTVDEARWVVAFDDEQADIVAAHRWCVSANQLNDASRLAWSAYLYAFPRGQTNLASLAQDVVVDPGAAADPDELALAYGAAADRAATAGDLDRAAHLLSTGFAVASGGTPGADRLCQGAAADLAMFRGQTGEALARYRAAADGFRVAGPVPFAVWIDAASALALSYSGRFADARDVARAARADADATGSPSLRAFARYASAESLAHAGPARARELLEEALELAESVGAEWVTGLVHLSLATLTARNGAPRDALAHYLALLDRWRRAGTWTQQWNALRTLVAVLVDLNRHEEAARLLGGIEAYAPTPRWGDDDARLRSAELRMRRALGDARCQDLFADGGDLAAIDVLAAAQQAVAVTLADHPTDEFDVPPSSALA